MTKEIVQRCGMISILFLLPSSVWAVPVVVPVIGVVGLLLFKASFFLLAAFFFAVSFFSRHARASTIIGAILFVIGFIVIIVL